MTKFILTLSAVSILASSALAQDAQVGASAEGNTPATTAVPTAGGEGGKTDKSSKSLYEVELSKMSKRRLAVEMARQGYLVGMNCSMASVIMGASVIAETFPKSSGLANRLATAVEKRIVKSEDGTGTPVEIITVNQKAPLVSEGPAAVMADLILAAQDLYRDHQLRPEIFATAKESFQQTGRNAQIFMGEGSACREAFGSLLDAGAELAKRPLKEVMTKFQEKTAEGVIDYLDMDGRKKRD